MNFKRLKIMGSSYVGLFSITNDKLCFVPHSIDDKAINILQDTLDVKTVKVNIYESALLAVFAKMNNKTVFLPSYALASEIETIEKEIKVKIINTEHAIGNLLAVNDTHAIVSTILRETEINAIKDEGLKILQTNIAKTNAIGSAILLTNKGFVINPNATTEEVKKVQESLNIKGGSSTANTGDGFIRNSLLANSKGAVVGELTTGFEINRIEEALE